MVSDAAEDKEVVYTVYYTGRAYIACANVCTQFVMYQVVRDSDMETEAVRARR